MQKKGHVFHYTSIDTFDILFPLVETTPPKLLLSPTELLNDPNEGAHFFDVLKRQDELPEVLLNSLAGHRQNMRAESGLSESDPLVFVASLCLEDDNLNLWRFYGNAKGVSFGVHKSQFEFDAEEGLSDHYNGQDKLYRVTYGKLAVEDALKHLMPAMAKLAELYKRRELQENLQRHIIKAMSGLLNTVAYLFKTTSYAAECECRLLRVQSIGDVRNGQCKTIGGIVRAESKTELVHEGIGEYRPVVTLGPQFDSINPERGQTRAIDRIRVALPKRQPIVKLSANKYRTPVEKLQVT